MYFSVLSETNMEDVILEDDVPAGGTAIAVAGSSTADMAQCPKPIVRYETGKGKRKKPKSFKSFRKDLKK